MYDWRRFLWHHRYAEAEKTNGRWAMAACAGILFTDAVGLPNWVTAGADVSTIDTMRQPSCRTFCGSTCSRRPCEHPKAVNLLARITTYNMTCTRRRT